MEDNKSPGFPTKPGRNRKNHVIEALKKLGPMMLAGLVADKYGGPAFNKIKEYGKKIISERTEAANIPNKNYSKTDVPNNPGMSNKIYDMPKRGIEGEIINNNPMQGEGTQTLYNMPPKAKTVPNILNISNNMENTISDVFQEVKSTDINSIDDMESDSFKKMKNETNIGY